MKINIVFGILQKCEDFCPITSADDGCDKLIYTMMTNPNTIDETEAIVRYFHLFHGKRFGQLRTFIGLYPSRFKEPFELPTPEEIHDDESDDDSSICDYQVVDCSAISYDERQRITETINVKIGRGVIIAMPIDLNPKCQESTAFRLKKLILYEYWNHDNDFGLAIECFNVFKERNTDSELIMQGLDRLDAARVAYNKACKNLMNFMFQES